MIKNLPAMCETWVHSIPGSGRSLGAGNGNPLQSSCLENSMDRGAWQALWGHKELDMTKWASLVAQRLKRLPPMQDTRGRSLGWEDPLEKEMVTHSSILAWRIPWMEEPARLQSRNE